MNGVLYEKSFEKAIDALDFERRLHNHADADSQFFGPSGKPCTWKEMASGKYKVPDDKKEP